MEDRRWVSVRQAEAYFNLPPTTLYSLIGRRRLPAAAILRLGRAIRVDVRAIESAQLGTGKGET